MSTKIERAERRIGRKLSSVWLVPIVALAIGVWMAYDTLSQQGQMITLQLERAEGIEAGKTLVKSQDVAVGRVEAVRLSDDFQHALVDIRMYRETDRMLHQETLFWVEKPRISRDGVQGLGTLLSGTFIQLYPGEFKHSNQQKRKFQDFFIALEQPPLLSASKPGLRLTLISPEAGGVNIGDPVLYQGFKVGRVEDLSFQIKDKQMKYQLFIEPEYQALITPKVRFWLRSGAQFELSSEGVKVDIGSLESLISGGIQFAAFEDASLEQTLDLQQHFTLYANEEEARQARYTQVIHFVALFEDSIRGLNKNAPVEYRGVRIGTVVEAPMKNTRQMQTSLREMAIPVLIRLEPERLNPTIKPAEVEAWQMGIINLFEQGLRASLRAGNLLTGSLFVDLSFQPQEAYLAAGQIEDYPTFPTVANAFAQLDQKVAALLDNLNAIKFDEFMDAASKTLDSSSDTLQSIAQTSEQIQAFLAQEDMQNLPQALVHALYELEQTFAGYSVDAPAYNELSQSLERLNNIMRELEPLSETLRDNPRALLFNAPTQKDPQVGGKK